MPQHKPVIASLSLHWRYCSLALSHDIIINIIHIIVGCKVGETSWKTSSQAPVFNLPHWLMINLCPTKGENDKIIADFHESSHSRWSELVSLTNDSGHKSGSHYTGGLGCRDSHLEDFTVTQIKLHQWNLDGLKQVTHQQSCWQRLDNVSHKTYHAIWWHILIQH